MKKILAILTALAMVLSAAAVLAEEETFTLHNGITFGMNMDQVIAAEPGEYEIDKEHTHGPVSFDELEYEHSTINGRPADLEYLFVGNELVAMRADFEKGAISYDEAKAELAALVNGEVVPVDLVLLGNGIYAVDDDGRLEDKAEAIVSGNLMIIIEEDEGEVNVTLVNLNAPYISA